VFQGFFITDRAFVAKQTPRLCLANFLIKVNKEFFNFSSYPGEQINNESHKGSFPVS
jgi:hypothetical protein